MRPSSGFLQSVILIPVAVDLQKLYLSLPLRVNVIIIPFISKYFQQPFKQRIIMAKKYTWKVWLRPNLMTKGALNDYIADVSVAGETRRNADIAKAIKEEGSDLQTETLIDVLNRADRWKRRYLLEGSSVQDGNVRMAPRVPGNWEGSDPRYDPKKHRSTIDATPTADLRKTFREEVGIEILGKKIDGGAVIGLVTDTCTGKSDGSITCTESIVITGKKIRVAPVGEAGLGIFLVAADGTETPATSVALNDPKRIICRVPELAAGEYGLKIVTRYASSTVLLKTPRTIVYEMHLTVVL
jgi:hypothetical protein